MNCRPGVRDGSGGSGVGKEANEGGVPAAGRGAQAAGVERKHGHLWGFFVAAMRGGDGLMARPGSRNYWRESEKELEPTEAQDRIGTKGTEVMGILQQFPSLAK